MLRNSTIQPRKKICKSCQTPQYIFSRGRCQLCARREDAKPLKKISDKVREAPKQDSGELQRWFEERHKEMSGKCLHCSGRSSKGTSQYKCSVAHILPKRLFKSVATHPLNWIELCFWNNSCHTNLDTHRLDITELNCFDLVIERFMVMYSSIDKNERKYIPDVFLQYIKNEIDL